MRRKCFKAREKRSNKCKYCPFYKDIIYPELCFAVLNLGDPLFEHKDKDEGKSKRKELLRCYYDKTEDVIAYAKKDQKLKGFSEDVIDALCLAVTGMVGLKNGLKSIPESPMMDKTGILMQMVYAETSK